MADATLLVCLSVLRCAFSPHSDQTALQAWGGCGSYQLPLQLVFPPPPDGLAVQVHGRMELNRLDLHVRALSALGIALDV